MTILEVRPGRENRRKVVRVGEEILVGEKGESHAVILQKLKPDEPFLEIVLRLKGGEEEGDMGDLTLTDKGDINVGGASGAFSFPDQNGDYEKNIASRKKTRELLAKIYDESTFV